MIASGGLSGGISSSIAGGSFWKGVREGIITSGLNHSLHMVMGDKIKQHSIDEKDNNVKEAIKEYIALVAGESSDDVLEAQGIGEVILRRAELKGLKLEPGWTKKIGKFDAVGRKIYNEIMNTAYDDVFQMKQYAVRIEGALNAIFLNNNVSKGAYFFNASSQQFQKNKGFNFKMYDNGTFDKTAELGKTTFFKYKDSNKKWP